MILSQDQLALVAKYRGENPPALANLTGIPEPDRRYKCPVCRHALSSADLQDGACPVCGEVAALRIMCPLDHTHCPHSVVGSLDSCPICGEPICPECGTHDVSQISRTTGHMSSLAGWDAGTAPTGLQVIPTPPEEAARYLGTGAPENLQYQVYPDGIVLAADYPYDEVALFAALADLGIDLALPPQFSPCG